MFRSKSPQHLESKGPRGVSTCSLEYLRAHPTLDKFGLVHLELLEILKTESDPKLLVYNQLLCRFVKNNLAFTVR